MAKKKTANKSAAELPEHYTKPANPWDDLTYKFKGEIPKELTNLMTLESGAPPKKGNYIFWYGPTLVYLGWSKLTPKKHLSIINAITKQHEVFPDLYSSIGKNGEPTKAPGTNQWVIQNSRWQCILFIEEREYDDNHSSQNSSNKVTQANSVVPKLFKRPESPWDSLTYSGNNKIPVDLEKVLQLNNGFPTQKGQYVFWYGPKKNYLGYTKSSDRLHTKLVWSINKNKVLSDHQITAQTGRNGVSWAISIPSHSKNKCLLFIEERKVSGPVVSTNASPATLLQNILTSHLKYLDKQLKHSELVDLIGTPFPDPFSLSDLEEYLKLVDPNKKIKTRELKKLVKEKERILNEQQEQLKNNFAKWVLEECIKRT
ncbi:hypothetical protein [Gimesia maris]|uniref:hypothetical protein n=1 Tax=Gimesia maris TaxID=122 RepID=UPI0030D740A7|tara:strand:+ start:93658 stop:94770 length:1113 start_codon:yes stop_codon:yes gene_type:complete